jgi:hypothetical protein
MKKTEENLKISTLEGKLTTNRIRWYGHILRMDEERIPKKVLITKIKGKRPSGRPR